MNCDPLARWYRWLEYLGMGRALERRRFKFLPELAAQGTSQKDAEASGRALVLGDGDGRFLERLLAVRPGLQVDYIDSSGEMLVLAHRRIKARLGAELTEERVVFHHADARRWLPDDGSRYDFIFTHFFLDCLTSQEADELLDRLEPFVAPSAVWIVSEFHQPPGRLSAWRAKAWISSLYWLFGMATGLKVRRLPDYRRSLQTHGFRMEREIVAEWGLLVSEWWQR